MRGVSMAIASLGIAALAALSTETMTAQGAKPALVVETTNFNDWAWNQFSGWSWPVDVNLSLVERFSGRG
jgi:hypothetical protein